MYNSLLKRAMFRRAGAWTSRVCNDFYMCVNVAAMRTVADSKAWDKAASKLKAEVKVEKVIKSARNNASKGSTNNSNKRTYTRRNKISNNNSISDRKLDKKALRAEKAKDSETKLHARSNVKAASTTSMLNTIMKDGLKVEGNEDLNKVSARPAYMSVEREEEVLKKAERMQLRDLTGEVPVPAFTFEILKAHPSLLNMGLRERMDFLLIRWSALSNKKRLEYLNDPLRGLL